MTFRRLGVAVVATAFTALVGVTAASAASTSQSMTTTQGGGAGTGGAAGTGASGNMTKASVCESRAEKRHLTGDQHDSYVKRCEAQANTKHHKSTASKTSAKPSSSTTTQGQSQGGASSTQSQ